MKTIKEMGLFTSNSSHTVSKFVLQRELGNKFPLGFQDFFKQRIYKSFSSDPKYGFWDQSMSTKSGSSARHGGVFNLVKYRLNYIKTINNFYF
jgi:hypothetical protein